MNSAKNTKKDQTNATADALSQVPIRHDQETVRSLLEGAVTGITERGRSPHKPTIERGM